MSASFLTELRQIGINIHQLSTTTLERLRRTPCLLGVQRKLHKKQQNESDVDDSEDHDWEVIYHFKMPSEIVIADDSQSLRAFGESLFIAPQEDTLEGSSEMSQYTTEG